LAEIQLARGEVDAARETAQKGRKIAENATDAVTVGRMDELLRRLDSDLGET